MSMRSESRLTIAGSLPEVWAYLSDVGRWWEWAPTVRKSWVAGGAYDAARLMIDALKRAAVQNRSDSKVVDRDRVRVALAAIDGPKSAVVGLTGRLYFNANRDIPRPIRLGFFRYGWFVTAPLQLVRIDQPDGIDLAAER